MKHPADIPELLDPFLKECRLVREKPKVDENTQKMLDLIKRTEFDEWYFGNDRGGE